MTARPRARHLWTSAELFALHDAVGIGPEWVLEANRRRMTEAVARARLERVTADRPDAHRPILGPRALVRDPATGAVVCEVARYHHPQLADRLRDLLTNAGIPDAEPVVDDQGHPTGEYSVRPQP